MKARILFGLFLGVMVLQLAVPAGGIWHSERALVGGREYRFRTAPVDPYDAFRGRYVALQFEQTTASWNFREPARVGQRVFVEIEGGSDGFARLRSAKKERPDHGDYLGARVRWVDSDRAVRVELPFNRFYMEETLAPRAESAYREHNARGRQDAYAVVRVKDGRAVIADLVIGGKPIAQFVREQKP